MRHIILVIALGLASHFNFVHAQENTDSETDVFSDDAAFADDAFDDDFGDFDDLDEEDLAPLVHDPLESFNRKVFWFNDKLYFYAIKPVAKAYRVVPEPARKSVSNFFSNLTSPLRMGNALLQGKFNDAGVELGRFMYNTSLGLGGLFDPADSLIGLRKKDEDFGQTLGHYGVEPGAYIVLPFWGPSNVRDSMGLVVDTFTDPVGLIWEDSDYWAAQAVRLTNTVSLDKDTYEAIKRDAFDPYLFLRDAYMKNRQIKVEQ